MAVCALALVIAFAFKRANYAVQTVVLTSALRIHHRRFVPSAEYS